jgi:hypothetical protein
MKNSKFGKFFKNDVIPYVTIIENNSISAYISCKEYKLFFL